MQSNNALQTLGKKKEKVRFCIYKLQGNKKILNGFEFHIVAI